MSSVDSRTLFQQAVAAKARTLNDSPGMLLVAPTGFGKTRAVLAPFADPQADPRWGTRLIYTLPLRALTGGVNSELERLGCQGTIHHGARPDSHLFTERAIVTTIDQYLTAFAGAPLSFSRTRSHVVAGAALASYAVFDEVHLLEPRQALPLLFSVLWLRQRWGLPSAVMSATLPQAVIEHLSRHLGLECLVPDEVHIQAARDKHRRVTLLYQDRSGDEDDQDLVRAIREQIEAVGKVIVYVNRVGRAVQLYGKLNDTLGGGVPVLLTHSRFAPSDRQSNEKRVLKFFGKGQTPGAAVLITTQVAEAGLDISAPVVFSDLAPADSLVQRAGRCCRWGDCAEGTVYVQCPAIQDYHLPYEKSLIADTKEYLQNLEGLHLTWEAEQKLVNDVLNDRYEAYIRGEGYRSRGKSRAGGREVLTAAEALATLERAYRERNPDAIESRLRNMLNVQVMVSESPTSTLADMNECLRSAEYEWRPPETISLSAFQFQVFMRRQSVRDVTYQLCYCDQGEFRLQDRLGPVLPGQMYLIAADVAGYDPRLGLTFDPGLGTASTPGVARGSSKSQPTRMQQTFEDHAAGTRRQLRRQLEFYHPFIERWAERVVSDDPGLRASVVGRLQVIMEVAATFHDVGKLSAKWQQAAGAGEIPLARTGTTAKLPIHGPLAFPFLTAVFQCAKVEGHFDFIPLAAARHHFLGPSDTVKWKGIELWPGSPAVLTGLSETFDLSSAWIEAAISALAQAGETELDAPSPADDFYPLYCWTVRLLTLADWEDAGHEEVELCLGR